MSLLSVARSLVIFPDINWTATTNVIIDKCRKITCVGSMLMIQSIFTEMNDSNATEISPRTV